MGRKCRVFSLSAMFCQHCTTTIFCSEDWKLVWDQSSGRGERLIVIEGRLLLMMCFFACILFCGQINVSAISRLLSSDPYELMGREKVDIFFLSLVGYICF